MIKVKTNLKEGSIDKSGIGLFTAEFIKNGKVVIVPSTFGLDIELDEKDLDKLHKEEKEVILHYGFKNKFNNKFHLNFGNERFINHSKNGNLKLDEETQGLFATRDIEAGEELTQDYSEFEKLREVLN
jgi:SET domain-containing protein